MDNLRSHDLDSDKGYTHTIYLSIYLLFYLSIYLSIVLSIYLSIDRSIDRSIYTGCIIVVFVLFLFIVHVGKR